jgi:hypothetical protein
MAGITATIDQHRLRQQWDDYVPMAGICSYWTITKDQLIRLRRVWGLTLRMDRKRRRSDYSLAAPTAAEQQASEASLNLAPMVAAAVTAVQAQWDTKTRDERQAVKPVPYRLGVTPVPEELREFVYRVER